MENTMLEFIEVCRQKKFYCMHDNVDDLIESALNSKFLSINLNSQRLDKEKQEVKNVMEQPAEHRTCIVESLQNFRVIHKKSYTSLKNTSQISLVHAIAPILSTEQPEYSLSMGYEHPNTTPKIESNEIIKSGVEELVPILSENEVTLEDKRECDVLVCEDSFTFDVYDDHSEIFSDSNNDDISSDDDAFEDIEYIEASLLVSKLVSLEEENVKEEEVDLEDIFQIQDVVLHEKLLSINRLIANIESLNDNPTPDCVRKSFASFPIFEESDNSLLDNSSPKFETFSDQTEEMRSGSTTTHDFLLEYDSFCFEIEPGQERLTSAVKNDISDDSTNDPLLEEVDLFLIVGNKMHKEFPLPGEIFADRSDKGFVLVWVDQERIVKRVPTSSYRDDSSDSHHPGGRHVYICISLMRKEVQKKASASCLIGLRGCQFGKELKSFIYNMEYSSRSPKIFSRILDCITLYTGARQQGITKVGYGIRDTWVNPAEAVPEIAPMTLGEVNTRVTELDELHEHDTQDLYALLEDAQDSKTRISQRVTMDSQRVIGAISGTASAGFTQDDSLGDSMDCGGGGLCFPSGLGLLDRIESDSLLGASDPPGLCVYTRDLDPGTSNITTATGHSHSDAAPGTDGRDSLSDERHTARDERIMAPATRQGPNAPPNDTNPNNMTPESVQAMIDQALLRNSTNRDENHSSHKDNRRNVKTARPCFYVDFMKCQSLNFKGTKGVVKFATCTLLDVALTWWNSQIRSLGSDAYAMT
nr:hypothetical protein [Tanacetum cinerariifolium]